MKRRNPVTPGEGEPDAKRHKGNEDDAQQAPPPTPVPPAPPSALPIPVPNLIWLVFTPGDADLGTFAHSAALVPITTGGPAIPIVHGTAPVHQLNVTDNLLVVAHGTPQCLANYNAPDPGDYATMTLANLAGALNGMIPNGYQGSIVLWCCNAARLYKHCPGGDTLAPDPGSRSFIIDLCPLLAQKGVAPAQVLGPIGYISLALGIRGAKVRPTMNPTESASVPVSQGMVSAAATEADLPPNFYVLLFGDNESTDSDSESFDPDRRGGGNSSDDDSESRRGSHSHHSSDSEP